MKTSDYIRISASDPRNLMNMGRIIAECETIKPFDKEVRKLDKLNLGIDITSDGKTMFAEFNKGGRWYVITQYSDKTWTLQENLEDGGIEYILDDVSFVKMFNYIKKM